mmetsp:Transcript_33350/g.103318  ORF Transcript_33350/g.103318 Transcript_33350/m.103318 type:complete len:240 (+) Transcript_33350:451-1170(+)
MFRETDDIACGHGDDAARRGDDLVLRQPLRLAPVEDPDAPVLEQHDVARMRIRVELAVAEQLRRPGAVERRVQAGPAPEKPPLRVRQNRGRGRRRRVAKDVQKLRAVQPLADQDALSTKIRQRRRRRHRFAEPRVVSKELREALELFQFNSKVKFVRAYVPIRPDHGRQVQARVEPQLLQEHGLAVHGVDVGEEQPLVAEVDLHGHLGTVETGAMDLRDGGGRDRRFVEGLEDVRDGSA